VLDTQSDDLYADRSKIENVTRGTPDKGSTSMKFRKLAVALVAGGALAMATALPAAATNAPYPPAPCAGAHGPGVINTTIPTPGGTITFTACGFRSGTVVVISLNGGAFTVVIASLKGKVTVPVKPWKLGHNTLKAVGLRQGANLGSLPLLQHRTQGASATSVARTVSASYPASDLRTVTAGFDVVKSVAGARSATPAHDAGLPLSGAEAGILGASALAFAGGGVGMRMVARRRRGAGNAPVL
jgi:hypothetical protein